MNFYNDPKLLRNEAERLIKMALSLEKKWIGKKYKGFTLIYNGQNKFVGSRSYKGKKYHCYMGLSAVDWKEKIDHFIEEKNIK